MIRTSVVGSGRWPADAGAVVTAVVASAAAASTASRVESLMSVLPPIRAQGPRTGARRRLLPREAVTYQGQKTDVKRMSPNGFHRAAPAPRVPGRRSWARVRSPAAAGTPRPARLSAARRRVAGRGSGRAPPTRPEPGHR